MFENLGIYNSHVNSDYDINKHIQQGAEFKEYGKKINTANEHIFLQESSSSTWGSIVDAYNGENSVTKRGLIEGMTMSENQIEFNNMVSQYSTDYKMYIANFLSKPQDPKYTDLGCWKDTGDRALTGPPKEYGYKPDTCQAYAKARGSSTFALQDGGWCVTNNPGDNYKKHGEATGPCPVGGGPSINHVYGVNDTYEASRKEAEAALLIQKNNILAMAEQLNIDINLSSINKANLLNVSDDYKVELNNRIDEINDYKKNRGEDERKHDGVSLDGTMEVSALRMNSMYYHVFVYLTVAVALVSFTFYYMVNPEANTLNAIYVLVALFGVYFISRYYVM